MKNIENILLSFIESLPALDRFLRKIIKDKVQKKSEIRESIAALQEDAEGKKYLGYLLHLTAIDTVGGHHIKYFFDLREQGNVSQQLQEHYVSLAETVLSFIISSYKPGRVEHSAIYLIADFFLVRRVDFILLAPAIFNHIIDPQDLTPPLVEKLCEILIEHYHIEDILIFLVTGTSYDQRQMLKIIHALSFSQKLYRKKREKRHRLLDKDKVARMWFQKPYKTLMRSTIKYYKKKLKFTESSKREIEMMIEKELLNNIRKRFKPDYLRQEINDIYPTALEQLGLELVLLRNNEDIFIYLIEALRLRNRLEGVCKYMWKYMHLLRMRSLHEDEDKETIHRLTVEYAFEEIKGKNPVILYIEDNGRYQDVFTRHVNFECQSLELATPKILVYGSVQEFKQHIPGIVEETKDALAHIFVIDGMLADGTWRLVLDEVKMIEKSLWQQRKETFYPVKYVFTGDIDIAREAYQAKILDHAPIDGVFVKPLESWDNAFLEISLRARKTGIQTDDCLYQRIVTIVKEVTA